MEHGESRNAPPRRGVGSGLVTPARPPAEFAFIAKDMATRTEVAKATGTKPGN